ncbi:hypothetical protein HaLaN_21154 [Haematococcus lacustris]|uniref:Uncharacterized protein n=1 Tax=Haematococcus lacustris TaxID=44745 RepID=A0A699ZMZ2_HAELA|nr:hypothetical protein HaLaN_21154 [Haematococcus lacustris]
MSDAPNTELLPGEVAVFEQRSNAWLVDMFTALDEGHFANLVLGQLDNSLPDKDD